MKYPLTLRVLFTYILLYLSLNGDNLIIPVLILLFCDLVDVVVISDSKQFVKTVDYHRYDKIADIISYVIFLLMYRHMIDGRIIQLLWAFVVYRLIGVIKFYNEYDTKYLKLFPDFINSTLVIYAMSKYIDINTDVFIPIGCIYKILFEQRMHNQQYN
jgi:hypothetical protein